jgi:hypothetical protein
MSTTSQLTPLVSHPGPLASGSGGNEVRFRVANYEAVTVQLVASGAWPVGLVVVAEVSLDGTNFADFPVPRGGVSESADQANDGRVSYTSAGMKHTLAIGGVIVLRFKVLTPAGSITVTPKLVGISST